MSSRHAKIAWGYLATSLTLLSGLLLIPAVVRHLSPPEVGLWFVFITLGGLSQLLEFGFQPTLARNVAYVFAGADTLAAAGLPGAAAVGATAPVNGQLVADLIAGAKRIYLIIAGLAAVVLLGGGSLYVSTLVSPEMHAGKVFAAWLLFALGLVVQLYYGYCNGLLQGRGDVVEANQVQVITKATLVAMGTFALALGAGLVGLGVASMLSCLVGRAAALWYVRRGEHGAGATARTTEARALARLLWHNASRFGLVQVGSFLIVRGNVLVASSFLGLTIAGRYGMTLTILSALSGVASVVGQVYLPQMNLLQAQGKLSELRATYGEVLLLAWGFFGIGALMLNALGNPVLEAIGANLRLVPAPMLVAMTCAMALEMNHSLAATYLTTTNRIDFMQAALASGAAILVLSLLLARPLGMWGLILSQSMVQLAYNNWKWPAEALKHLGATPADLIREGGSQLRTLGTLPAVFASKKNGNL